MSHTKRYVTLVKAIAEWQREALNIKPPSGTDRLLAVGGLPGPAFFPEGMGLSYRFDADW